jgi:hypothetical protein
MSIIYNFPLLIVPYAISYFFHKVHYVYFIFEQFVCIARFKSNIVSSDIYLDGGRNDLFGIEVRSIKRSRTAV